MCNKCEYCDVSCVEVKVASDSIVQSYTDFLPIGKQVLPDRSADSIMWTIKFRNGNVKRFKFATK